MSNEFNEETAKELNYLFSLMLGFFPSTKMTINCSEDFDFMKKRWAIGLKLAGIIDENGLNKDLFYTGINALAFFNNQYMPSLGQFVNMCFYGVDNKRVNEGSMQENPV